MGSESSHPDHPGCCRSWMRNWSLCVCSLRILPLGASWYCPSPDVWRVPPGPWTWGSGSPCPRGSGLLQLLGATLADCPPECEVLPEGIPGETPGRRLLQSEVCRGGLPSADLPGPPGSGLRSPSRWDRKPISSLDWGLGARSWSKAQGSNPHNLSSISRSHTVEGSSSQSCPGTPTCTVV